MNCFPDNCLIDQHFLHHFQFSHRLSLGPAFGTQNFLGLTVAEAITMIYYNLQKLKQLNRTLRFTKNEQIKINR